MADDERITTLTAEFDGAIKYGPMLESNTAWTDQQCVDYAREQHSSAIKGLRLAIAAELAGGAHWWDQTPGWNDKIAFCRNMPTAAMLKEAMDGL